MYPKGYRGFESPSLRHAPPAASKVPGFRIRTLPGPGRPASPGAACDDPVSSIRIHTESGGSGGPVLVMLHGIGANAAVWNRMLPVVERRWPGRWIAADLRGHGRSAHAPPYGYAGFAADVAGAIGSPDEAPVLLGHSMGGVVAMALATGWFGLAVRRVFAFGVKIGWTADEVAQMHALAARPARVFGSYAEAAGRYLRVSGLVGLVDPESPEARAGVAEADGGFRLAADQGVYAAVGPAVAEFRRAANAPVRLAAGEADPMVGLAEMQALDPQAALLPGLGHNCHVEAPERVWALFERILDE